MSLSPANSLFVAQTLAKLDRADSVVPLSLQPFCSELLVRWGTAGLTGIPTYRIRLLP